MFAVRFRTYMDNRIDVLGIGFDNVTTDEALAHAEKCVAGRTSAYVVTPNPEIVWSCRTNPELQRAVRGAGLVLPDGIGIIYGAKILKRPLKGRVTGIGFAEQLCERLSKSGGSVYLLGARPGVAEKAGDKLTERFSGLIIAGVHDGYFDDDEAVIADINEKTPDFLIVCLGFPRQELWAAKYAERLNTGIIACLGGALDVLSGETVRAPKWMQKAGLEWLYRLVRQPSRLVRMMSLPKFLFAVILESFRKR